jgi:hypothetical protein
VFRVGHRGEGIDDAGTIEGAEEIDNDYPPRMVRRIIDAALATGRGPEELGPPPIVMEEFLFLDSIPER